MGGDLLPKLNSTRTSDCGGKLPRQCFHFEVSDPWDLPLRGVYYNWSLHSEPNDRCRTAVSVRTHECADVQTA